MPTQNDNLHRIDWFFTQRMFNRQYVPSLITAVVLSFGDIADSLVLGNRIGYIGLAALALTMPVSQVFNIIMNALGIGGCVRYANRMARGRKDQAVAGFQGVVCAAVLAGAALALLGNLLMTPLLGLLGASPGDGGLFNAAGKYLRILLMGSPILFLNYVLNFFLKADDREKEASVAFTAGNIVDIGLNILLVLVFRMDVTGAGLATVAGQTVGAGISLFVVSRPGGELTLKRMKPDWKEAGKSFRVGLSSSISYFYSLIYLLIANNLLLRTMGGAGAAMLDVLLGVSYFMMNLYDAVSQSILPVVSTYHGERNENGMRLARNAGLMAAVISGSLLAAATFLFPEAICRFFGMDDPAMLASGAEALRIYSLSLPLAGISILLMGVYEARKQPGMTLMITTLRGVMRIAAALIMTLWMPNRFWFMYVAAEALTLCVYGVLYLVRKQKKTDNERVFRSTIYSTETEVSRTTEQIEAFCERWNANPGQQYLAMMAVEEICLAMMNSGFHGKKDGFIQIVLVALEQGGFELHIRDNAASFNPLAMEMKGNPGDQDADLDALGILMIRKKAKSLAYRHFQGFNTVIIQI